MSKSLQIPHKFQCRPYQISAWEAWKARKRKMCLCWHRGAGKDLFALNCFIWRMVREPAVYLHCFPQYSQGKKAIWNSLHQTDEQEPISYLDHFPKEIIKYKNSTEMRIELFNGAIYCIMGIDGKNAQLARGMNPTHVIVSEYAYMNEESWDVIEPRVSQNGGTVIFASTPNGKNHFYREFNYAASGHKPDYFASLVTNDDTHIHTNEHLEDLRAKGKPEDFIRQEYFCDFSRGAAGSYYGNLIQKARQEERICTLRVSPNLPVHSAWDIGIGDSNAIFLFQCLNNGNINVLHYYENSNEGLPHYLKYLDNWKAKHQAIWGTHFVPHDMQNREYTSGDDRLSAARNLGYEMRIVPKKGIEDGIEAVRSLLPHCSFDEKECKRGIDCLDFYRKKWNDTLKVYYDVPLHDQYSHGADAFRMLAVGINALGTGGNNKLTPEKIREMRVKSYGY